MAPRGTGSVSLEGARNKGKRNFSLTIFFFDHVTPTATGPGSMESARRSLYAHIFFVHIGPIVTDTKSNRTGVVGKCSSRPLCPYFLRPDQSNRSRVITHLEHPDRGHWKGFVAPSTHMFFSSRSDQYELRNKGKRNFHLPIFSSETIAHRVNGTGLLEWARRALYSHIFFVQIGRSGADNRTGITGKGSSRPLRPYFFRPDRLIKSRGYNGLKGTNKKKFFFNNFFLRNYSTQSNRTGVIGQGSSHHLRPFFCRPNQTNTSRVITLPTFSSETIAPRAPGPGSDDQEPSNNVTGPGSLETVRRALYTHTFFRPDRTCNSRVITREQRRKNFSLTIFFSETIAPSVTGPGLLEWGRRALYAHTFFVQIRPANNGKENYSLSIFFNETIAPRSTGPVSLQRDRRALCAHILFSKPDRGRWKVFVAPSTPILFSSRSDQQQPNYIGLKRTKKKKFFFCNFFLRNYNTWSNRTAVIGKGSSRPLLPYFFCPDLTNRSRVITV
ncbi:LOW QUALITY PROTEIN: hypothetical protein V1477_006254 [Vespula maculifrons]|uniref:Uncharacterized protein n=1 Tax=Vespula maculifrons TaxID=7453 RepID=A0ABD2CKQ5_VESMC